jgi:polysaccharide biosynthesis protein PslH
LRFVWITKEVPLNPESGLLLYSNGLIQGLLENGATGTLVAYTREGAEGATLPGLQVETIPAPHNKRILSLFTSMYSDSCRFYSKAFEKLVERVLQTEPDVVVIDYFSTGWILPAVHKAIARHVNRPVLVYIAHNHESTLRRQVANSIKNPLMRSVLRADAAKAAKLEKRLLAASGLVVSISDEDRRRFEADAPGKPVLTLTPAYDGDILPTRSINAALPRRVILVGAFDWIAKQNNLRRFLSVAQEPFQSAGVDLLVVGRAPQPLIEELTAKHSFCRFTGRVDDVRPYLFDGRIGLMPDDVGGGFKLKYLYYIFAGLPVATIRSQLTSLPVDPDRDVIARNTMEELVAGILENIDDLPRLDGMRQRCWDACATSFSWRERGARLCQAVEALGARAGSAAVL